MKILIIMCLALGWLAVLGGLLLPLTGAVPLDALGLAFMVTAVVIALWPERETG